MFFTFSAPQDEFKYIWEKTEISAAAYPKLDMQQYYSLVP